MSKKWVVFRKIFTFEKLNLVNMASIRRLKKDVDCLTFAVVDDCLNCLYYGKNSDDVSEIVQQAIDSRNGLRQRVNAGRRLSGKERKSHYQAVYKDLMVSVDGAFSKLSEMIKQA